MTSTTFFIIFVPILGVLLLAINLILAPHNPYQEKDSAFECGFHSFLGQNRTQFSISFFIFGLLFLLFDLEILLVYPYSVSSYSNDIYGLVIMMVFFVLLTLGFIFELGKNALTIDSRQTLSYSNDHTATIHVFTNLILNSKIRTLNLFRKKVKNNLMYISLNTDYKENSKIETSSERYEYKKMIFYPFSPKEWFNSIYSYQKSYIKPLIIFDKIIYTLVKIYLNMLKYKKHPFKRRRHNRIRYSANKIYSGRAELLHTNSKIHIILYLYNKPKAAIKRNIRKIVTLRKFYRFIYKNKVKYIPYYKNRIFFSLKKKFFVFKKWNTVCFKPIYNMLNYFLLRKNYLFKPYKINYRLLKKFFKLQKRFFNTKKSIDFNKYKLNNLSVSFRNLGLISMIEKLYDKSVIINFVEKKSIHLNSDIFASAVALKLRNRKNKAIRVLRKAIVKMVTIPDLHTRITFDDLSEVMNKNNIITTIQQQAVNGVRFKASGRLTKRLTAQRAISKVRYVGSLKNIRSSLNNLSSTLLRGYAKSNLEYININSKTRNGTFGLKTWVSSHILMLKSGIIFKKLLTWFIKKWPNILIIFGIGLIGRIFINQYLGVSFFTDCFELTSIFYNPLLICFTPYIYGIEFNFTLGSFVELNKNLLVIIKSILPSFTLESLTLENLSLNKLICGIRKLIDGYGKNTMTMNAENSSSKVTDLPEDLAKNRPKDLTKDEGIVMRMNGPEQGSSSNNDFSGTRKPIARSCKKNISYSLVDDDRFNDNNNHSNKRLTSDDIEDSSNLNKTKEERRRRLAKERSAKYKINHREELREKARVYRQNPGRTDQEKREAYIKKKELLDNRKRIVDEKNAQDYMNYLDNRARGNKSIEELKKLAEMPVVSGFKSRNAVWLVDSENKKIGPYISQKEAANDLDVCYKIVSNGVNYDNKITCKRDTGNIHTKLGETYNVKKVMRLDEELTRADVRRIFDTPLHGIGIVAIDSKGNEINYTSKIEVSRKLKIDGRTIDKRIKDGKVFGGYTFKKK